MSSSHQGFVDLRVGNSARGEDSVWPSFTDIMTVIVMIFLMALVVMLVRNFDLVNQLSVSETSRDISLEENRKLLNRVQILQQHNQGLQQRHVVLQGKLQQQLERSESLTANNLHLAQQLANLVRERDRISAEKQQLKITSQQRLSDALAKITLLEQSITDRQVEIADLKKLAEKRFRSLQQEYNELDSKYRTLVRPARNTAGKYVVSVRILKSAGKYQFSFREPRGSARNYSYADLHKHLAALKRKHGKKLYTKVIIPKDSALSHNEAWRLTREVQIYDYYYQQDN